MPAVQTCKACKSGYIGFKLYNKLYCYDFTNFITTSYKEAKSICQSNGDMLPIPQSKVENDSFAKRIREKLDKKGATTQLVLDLKYKSADGFVMSNGQKPPWKNFLPGQESKVNDQAFGIMTSSGFWVSNNVGFKANVVCQQACMPITSKPTTITTTTKCKLLLTLNLP